MDIEDAVQLGILRCQMAALEAMLQTADSDPSVGLTTEMVRNVMASAKEKYLDKVQQWAEKNLKGK
jgi:hypothetical protein